MKPIPIALTEADWNVIMQALAEMPFRLSAPVIQRIQQQAAARAPEPQPAAQPAAQPEPIPLAAE